MESGFEPGNPPTPKPTTRPPQPSRDTGLCGLVVLSFCSEIRRGFFRDRPDNFEPCPGYEDNISACKPSCLLQWGRLTHCCRLNVNRFNVHQANIYEGSLMESCLKSRSL
ncbi:hypothetical protein AVEN_208083-1 [Araneus ventricosus]|uniref:Uncharacterized protein n=1 Tax=Araneus ventricosus TaxID=182803 RepID=A0A4Y2FX90_ARAVE|nr:hypothetical protein AVEN_208083-1 [Araneus ventricosus]